MNHLRASSLIGGDVGDPFVRLLSRVIARRPTFARRYESRDGGNNGTEE